MWENINLLVDDEMDILDIQKRYLMQEELPCFSKLEMAWRGWIFSRKKSVDLIIWTSLLPNMDSYGFISEFSI